MMEWRTVKTVEVPYTGGVRFLTLYEDKRDVMCDSVRPEWGVADREKSHRIDWYDTLMNIVQSLEVDKDTGNQIYLKVKALSKPGSGFPPAQLALVFSKAESRTA